MSSVSKQWLWLWAVTLTALLPGCSGDDTVQLVPAQGIVKIKGQPVAGIMVRMVPEVKTTKGAIASEGGMASTGVTNEAGEFRLDRKSVV